MALRSVVSSTDERADPWVAAGAMDWLLYDWLMAHRDGPASIAIEIRAGRDDDAALIVSAAAASAVARARSSQAEICHGRTPCRIERHAFRTDQAHRRGTDQVIGTIRSATFWVENCCVWPSGYTMNTPKSVASGTRHSVTGVSSGRLRNLSPVFRVRGPKDLSSPRDVMCVART